MQTTDLFNFFHDELKEVIRGMHWMDKFCEISGISKENAEECYWKNKEIENNNDANNKLVSYIISLGYKESLYNFMSI